MPWHEHAVDGANCDGWATPGSTGTDAAKAGTTEAATSTASSARRRDADLTTAMRDLQDETVTTRQRRQVAI
jgi:hypothetical protein